MKKLGLRLIIVWFITLMPITINASNWYYIGSLENSNTSMFIDNDSVKKNEDSAEVWIKSNKSDGSYSLDLYRFNRKYRTIAIITSTDYNSLGEVVETYHFKIKYEPIIPDSIGETIFKLIW